MSGPCASVLVPSFNHARFLEQALESVFRQTFSDFEVLVVDDGSTDGTSEILERHAGRIRAYPRPHSGIGATYNFGLSRAAGRYVAVLESDDLWAPEYLERVVSRMEADPDVVFLTTARKTIDGEGHETGRVIRKRTPGPSFTTEDILRRDWAAVSTPVLRRAALERIGPYDETLRFGGDSELALRVSLRFKTAYLDEPLYCYREHADNASGDTLVTLREALCVLVRFTETQTELPGPVRRAVRRRYGRLHARLGKLMLRDPAASREETLRHLGEAIGYTPFRPRSYLLLLRAFLSAR